MSAIPLDSKRNWVLAAAGGFAVAAIFVAIVDVSTTLPVREPRQPKMVELRQVTAADSLRSEEAGLRDLAPLFLPTDRNARLTRMPQREPGEVFLDKKIEMLAFSDAGWNFQANLPPIVTLNGKVPSKAGALDALLANNPAPPLFGFGRVQAEVPALPARGGLVEIVASGTGQRVLVEELAINMRPPTQRVWQPLEFIAAIDSKGLTVPLTQTVRSGVEEVDQYFRNFLARTYRIGERLTPGFYRITVAP